MIRKSISLALCFSTVLSSISWSMENIDPQQASSSNQSGFKAFYVSNSDIQRTLQQNIGSETAQAFIQGAREGFSSYASDSLGFLQNIASGNFMALGTSTINGLIQESLGMSLRRYQQRNTDTHKRGEIDADSVKCLFTIAREAIYTALLKTGSFGNKTRVHILERNVTETHCDVTLKMGATLVGALLPESLPLRGALISLINTDLINTFILNQIDGLFARLTVQYFEKITGSKINEVILKSAGIVGFSGVALSGIAIQSALTDYDDANGIPSLAQANNPGFSELWNYISPRMTHFIRIGLIESVITLSGLTADKITDPVVLAVTKAATNNSYVNSLITGVASGYYIGEALTPVPYIDAIAFGGASALATYGAIQYALPRGLDQSRRKVIDMVMQTLRLHATYYVNSALPLTQNEHRLYGLNPNPTPTESSLFREDYEARDQLNQQNLMTAILQDLAKAVNTSLTTLMETTGINKLAATLFGSGNADGLVLMNAHQGHAQANHNDTVARIKLFELAKALCDIDTQKSIFSSNAPWYSRALAYLNGQIPSQLALTSEQQELLDLIRAHPSFDLIKAELDHLAKHFTLLSKNDRETKLQPYEQERLKLSAQFTQDAIKVLTKIESAKTALTRSSKNPEDGIKTLMTGLSFDHFVMALDALNNEDVRARFDFDRPLTDLPAFAIAVTDFEGLLRDHGDLVKLIQTTSLGAGLTLREQLELAQRLSLVDDAAKSLTAKMYNPVDQLIPNLEAPALLARYHGYVGHYIGYAYGKIFIDTLVPAELAEIVSNLKPVVVTDDGKISAEYIQKCLFDLYQNPDFKSFKDALAEKGVSPRLRPCVYQHILEELINLKAAQEKEISASSSSPSVDKIELASSGWFNWASFNWGVKATPSTTSIDSQSSEFVVVSVDPSQESTLVTLPKNFKMSALTVTPLESLESDGFEAYFVAKTIKEMLTDNPEVFGNRSVFDLTEQDMLKVTQRIDDIRRSQIISSEEMLLIERHRTELAGLIQSTDHANSVIWTYGTILSDLRQKALDAINSVGNSNAQPLIIIDNYVGSQSATSSDTGSPVSENSDQ